MEVTKKMDAPNPRSDRPFLFQARVDLCPIKESAKILGKKWYLVIVHRLLDKPRGFNELKENVGEISAKILSQALQDMAERGIVERRVSSESPVRVEYSLTEQGKDLAGVLKELYDWGKKWALCADKRAAAPEPVGLRSSPPERGFGFSATSA